MNYFGYKKNTFVVILFAVLLIAACGVDYCYQSDMEIPEAGWAYQKAAAFETNIEDTSQVYNLIFALTNTDEYRFCNIWFFVKTISPTGNTHKDTLEYFISETNGKWLGNEKDGEWTSKMYFKNTVRLPEVGKYRFEIQQGMREDTLKGITKIAFLMQEIEN